MSGPESNKIKHYTSKIKADTKLCSSSFSVITPQYFVLGQGHLLSACAWH